VVKELKKAIFLDRDGTLNFDPGYLSDPSMLKLFPGVALGLSQLKTAGYELVVVTNQSGVGRGLIELSKIPLIHDRLNQLLNEEAPGLGITHFEFCTKLPEDPSSRRKPKPDLILDSAKSLSIDCLQSWMIGDRLSDIEAGKRAKCKGTILVKTGHGNESLKELSQFRLSQPKRYAEVCPTAICEGLLEAAHFILRSTEKS
jgi:histidinol-phosphate phosphatase family protein